MIKRQKLGGGAQGAGTQTSKEAMLAGKCWSLRGRDGVGSASVGKKDKLDSVSVSGKKCHCQCKGACWGNETWSKD